jgi:hypothetical protein
VKKILFLVIIAVLVSGCVIGDGDRDYAMSHITQTDARSSATPLTPMPVPVNPIQRSLYWIKIDPISNKQEGDVFTVNASTNLSAGEEILVLVHREGRYGKSQSGLYPGGQGIAKAMIERNGNNSISFTINSSEFNLTPATYRVFEEAIHENASGWALFNITEENPR